MCGFYSQIDLIPNHERRLGMGKMASVEHDQVLQHYVETAKKLGRRVIDLNDKSPDAIEVYVENGDIKINVIEIMHTTNKNIGKLSTLSKLKKELYEGLGFDEVKVYEYNPEDFVTSKRVKRVHVVSDFSYTCRRCGQGFMNVSDYQSHIYHKHTKKTKL